MECNLKPSLQGCPSVDTSRIKTAERLTVQIQPCHGPQTQKAKKMCHGSQTHIDTISNRNSERVPVQILCHGSQNHLDTISKRHYERVTVQILCHGQQTQKHIFI